MPDLPSAALTMYPATPVMLQDAREARLRELPGEVMGALANNPQ